MNKTKNINIVLMTFILLFSVPVSAFANSLTDGAVVFSGTWLPIPVKFASVDEKETARDDLETVLREFCDVLQELDEDTIIIKK